MKAAVFTHDKISFEVIQRCLVANGFMGVVQLLSPQIILPENDDVVVFVDLDKAEFGDVAARVPDGTVVVPFGRYESRVKALETMNAKFLMKPFNREDIDRVVREALLGSVILMTARAPARMSDATVRLAAAVSESLRQVAVRRQELATLLTATPEQLRMLLAPKMVRDESGRLQLPIEIFPIGAALVVDADQAFSRLAARYLANKCIMQVEMVANGEEAWERLRKGHYDIIVMQWEVPGLSGLALYNRLRTVAKTRYVPVLISSSSLNASDFRLLDEDFAVTLLQRPVAEKEFSMSLETVIGDAVVSLERQAELVLLVGQAVQENIIEVILEGGGSKVEPLLLNAIRLAGDEFVAVGQYELAKVAFAAAWKIGDRRMSLLMGYARACHLAGNHRAASRLLATADTLAPKNVERLCLLGEVDLCMKNPDRALQRFQTALNIDGGAQKARAGVYVAEKLLELGEFEEVGAAASLWHLAAYLNLVGVDLSKNGKLREAIRYYKSAMVFIRKRDDLVKLWFNVGLCYLRGNAPEKAHEAFKKTHEAFKKTNMLAGGSFERVKKYLQDDAAFEAGAELETL